MESIGIEYPLKTKIKHKTQNVNAKHFQCQCIVSGRHISLLYISFFSGTQFEKTDLENLEQSLCFRILWF